MLAPPRSLPHFRHYSSEGGSIPRRLYPLTAPPNPDELADSIQVQNREAPLDDPAAPDGSVQEGDRANQPLEEDDRTVYHPEDGPIPRGDKPQGLVENFLFACCGIHPALSVVVAMDSFKGSLTSREAASVIESALRASNVERIFTLPLSDGGEGYLDAFKAIYSDTFQILRVGKVLGPMGLPLPQEQPVMYDIDNSIAVIESAHACGLTLVDPANLDPRRATSYGVGQMIQQAIQAGARTVYVGVGGTATVDGGIGLAQALGVNFFDEAGNELMADQGDLLSKVARVDTEAIRGMVEEIKFVVGADVMNSLCGAEGAVTVYGPQKGVKPQDIPILDHHMQKYAALVENETNQTGMSRNPRTGAGGGIAFALATFFKAELTSGFATIASRSELESRIQKADLVITGEGTFDASSLYGKLPIEVGRLCKAAGTTCILYTGRCSQDIHDRPEDGISVIKPLLDSRASPEEVEKAKINAKELLFNAVTKDLKLLRLGKEVSI